MKPGINYNVPEHAYHAFEAVSKSKLWKFAKSPSKWAATRHIPFKTTAAMTWGSLVDCLLLQPAEVDRCFAISPFQDFKTKAAREWRDAQPREIITQETLDEAHKAVAAILRHDKAAEVVACSTSQVSPLVEGLEEQTGEVFLGKCRLDLVPSVSGEYGEWLFDLKTTASLDKLSSTIRDFGYHVQAAWYLDMWNAAALEERERWGFIFQESEFPYEVAVVELPRRAIEKGREWYLENLALWCKCHRDGVFPSPWDGQIKTVDLPEWEYRD